MVGRRTPTDATAGTVGQLGSGRLPGRRPFHRLRRAPLVSTDQFYCLRQAAFSSPTGPQLPSGPMEHPMRERVEDLHKRSEQALPPGSERSVERQHERGKMLARERIELPARRGLVPRARHAGPPPCRRALDERPYTDGVITGWGTVDGRKVFVFSQDFTVFGGALGEVFAEKIHKLMDLALKVGAPRHRPQRRRRCPHPGGRRVSLASYGGIFYRNVKASGVTPADLGDHGPVRRRRGLQPGHDRLHLHGRRDLVHVHHRPRRGEAGDRRGRHPAGARRRPRAHRRSRASRSSSRPTTSLPRRRPLPARLPARRTTSRSRRSSPRTTRRPALPGAATTSSPTSPNQPYDMRDVIEAVVDDGDFFEYAPNWAGSIIVRLRPPRRPLGRHRRQPADDARRRARHRVVVEGGPVRAHLRRVQHPARHVRRRARASCPASTRSTAASSATAPSCSTPTARPPCRASR